MAMTKSTDLTNSAVTNYKKEALEFAYGEETWGQFVDWDDPIPDDGGNAASFDYLAYGEIDPAITALTQDSDVTPVALADYNVTVTPYEYGNAVGRTQAAAFRSRVKTQETFGRLVGKNRTRSVDRLIRNGIMGGSLVNRPDGVAARTTLAKGTASHLPTYDWLMELRTFMVNMGVEPMDGKNFVSVVNPLVTRELAKLTEWKSPHYYRPSDAGGDLYKGEVGMLANIRFIESMFGKVYLCGGATAQAATTTTAAANKNATTIAVTSASGLAAGDYIVVGTLESATAEQVKITGVDSTTLTIQGLGDGPSTFGLRFDHASGSAVTEATNVGAIPLIGKQSIKGVYGARTGKYGQFGVTEKLDIMQRFSYFWWYWFGGIGIVERNILRGECALTGGMLGYN